jgi:hypothetical protein
MKVICCTRKPKLKSPGTPKICCMIHVEQYCWLQFDMISYCYTQLYESLADILTNIDQVALVLVDSTELMLQSVDFGLKLRYSLIGCHNRATKEEIDEIRRMLEYVRCEAGVVPSMRSLLHRSIFTTNYPRAYRAYLYPESAIEPSRHPISSEK